MEVSDGGRVIVEANLGSRYQRGATIVRPCARLLRHTEHDRDLMPTRAHAEQVHCENLLTLGCSYAWLENETQ